jgi:formamidopyrimidine-DNA glycosylase
MGKMPEMPEVETIARKLRHSIVGKTVADVHLSGYPLRKPIPASFAECLKGRKIIRILRRGKYLIAELEPKAFWLLHLGMSGRILFHSPPCAGTKHTHAIIRFADSTELEYRDQRRFGLLAAYEVKQLRQVPEIGHLGPDPLSPRFDEKWLGPLLRKSQQEIKSFLLDQHRVAGLGNIYVCEALFLARIHPSRRCFTIASEETSLLIKAIRKVLRVAVRHNGTSFSDFMDSDGVQGENQRYLMVFQREGKKCMRCGAPIRRMRQATRSSFFCSFCQE